MQCCGHKPNGFVLQKQNQYGDYVKVIKFCDWNKHKTKAHNKQ